MKTQLTLWIPEDLEKKIRDTSLSLETNRQGAIIHILQSYFLKELTESSAIEMQ